MYDQCLLYAVQLLYFFAVIFGALVSTAARSFPSHPDRFSPATERGFLVRVAKRSGRVCQEPARTRWYGMFRNSFSQRHFRRGGAYNCWSAPRSRAGRHNGPRLRALRIRRRRAVRGLLHADFWSWERCGGDGTSVDPCMNALPELFLRELMAYFFWVADEYNSTKSRFNNSCLLLLGVERAGFTVS